MATLGGQRMEPMPHPRQSRPDVLSFDASPTGCGRLRVGRFHAAAVPCTGIRRRHGKRRTFRRRAHTRPLGVGCRVMVVGNEVFDNRIVDQDDERKAKVQAVQAPKVAWRRVSLPVVEGFVPPTVLVLAGCGFSAFEGRARRVNFTVKLRRADGGCLGTSRR